MTRVSFIVCSHRAPPELDAALLSICAQDDPHDAELVIVNNGFAHERESQVEALLAASGRMPWRIVREPRPGLGFARRVAFLVADGEYFVLLDDDNEIAPDVLAELRAFLSRAGPLACVCPAVEPRWLGEKPPAWLRDFGRLCLSYNAVDGHAATFQERVWTGASRGVAMRPPGGGMILHRAAVEKYLSVADEARLALGRGPRTLHGSEDHDLFLQACSVGTPVAYCARIRAFHTIAPARLRWSYLRRLNFEMGQSYGALARLTQANPARTLVRSAARVAISPLRSKAHPRALALLLLREAGFLSGFLRRAPAARTPAAT